MRPIRGARNHPNPRKYHRYSLRIRAAPGIHGWTTPDRPPVLRQPLRGCLEQEVRGRHRGAGAAEAVALGAVDAEAILDARAERAQEGEVVHLLDALGDEV